MHVVLSDDELDWMQGVMPNKVASMMVNIVTIMLTTLFGITPCITMCQPSHSCVGFCVSSHVALWSFCSAAKVMNIDMFSVGIRYTMLRIALTRRLMLSAKPSFTPTFLNVPVGLMLSDLTSRVHMLKALMLAGDL